MKKFDTLYARNSNGKINQWSVQAHDDGTVIILEGLLKGLLTDTRRKAKGKNLGKMNETTAYEQALKDAESRWNDKKKKGYKSLEELEIGIMGEGNSEPTNLYNIIDLALPIYRTDASGFLKPMLAAKYFRDNGTVRIPFPCLGQPKLNGFRVLVKWGKVTEGEGMFKQEVEKAIFTSREGLRFDTLDYIGNELRKIDFLYNDGESLTEIIFDGEIYLPGEILSEISSAVKKLNDKTIKLKLYIFDLAIEGMKQQQRTNLLEIYKSSCFFQNIHFVPTVRVNNTLEAEIYTDKWIKEGYEGGIFRDPKSEYGFGSRTGAMVKLKRSEDKEFKITNIISGDNSPELGIFICVAENGEEFKVSPEGSHEIKKKYLAEKELYIGKKLTVRFFERTKNGVPFHAVGVVVRDYE